MNIQIFNNIAKKGLSLFTPNLYNVGNNIEQPLGILLRSHKLQESEVNKSVLGIARCGSGVNNIPIKTMTNKGIVVFNTPGANANAVKELTICSMLLASRGIYNGINYIKHNTDNLNIEDKKKEYKGTELYGKTLGIIGLGNIGRLVGETAHSLGMDVIGYDPYLSLKDAWKVSGDKITKVDELKQFLSEINYLTLHIPFIKDVTENLINKELIDILKSDVHIINMSRDGLIDEKVLYEKYVSKELTGNYVTDFYNKIFDNCSNVSTMPHLGASTNEAEENSAIMAVQQMKNFLEYGNIKNSVNLPDIKLSMTNDTKFRLTVINNNNPGVISHISNILHDNNINILQQVNKSKDAIAYSIFDLDKFREDLVQNLKFHDDIKKIRIIKLNT